jgi:hypothetical protein
VYIVLSYFQPTSGEGKKSKNVALPIPTTICYLCMLFSMFTATFFMYFFIIVQGRGTLWHLQTFLRYIKCIILESTLSTILFHTHVSRSWNSFNRHHFSIYIYAYTVFSPFLHTHVHTHIYSLAILFSWVTILIRNKTFLQAGQFS